MMLAAQLIFAEPLWLWITAGVLLCFGGLLWFSARQRRRQLAAFAEPEQLASLLAAHSTPRRVVKNSLLGIGIALFGIALARPQWGEVAEEVTRRGEDVVFVLDTSKSMLAADALPTRLGKAKNAIREFVHSHAGGRVGLVAFAGDGFLMCPLTLDYDAFEEAVGEIDTDAVVVPGSDIAAALFAGKNAFEKTERRKVLILITDGEDLGKLGIEAAKKLAEENVVVFTVGVGTPNGALIQVVPQPDGRPGPLLDDTGQPVTSRLDEATLQAIAQTTGGAYRRLDTIGGGMAAVVRSLRDSEARPTPAQVRRRGIDRYAWPLAVAICLLVVESVLHTRRRRAANA